MVTKDFAQRVVEDVGRRVVVSQGPSAELRKVCEKKKKKGFDNSRAYFVIRSNNLSSQRESTILEMSGVQHITTVRLDIDDFEIGHTVDHNVTCVVLLTTRFGIEACLIQNESKGCIFWNIFGRLEKRLVVKYRLDN